MKITRQRAFRFLHPDFDADVGAAPGLVAEHSGRIAMARGDTAVRQSLLLLLSTTPGERVMRPRYGCDLRRLVFSPNDNTTAGLAQHYVRRAVEQWEPRVRVHRVDARPDDGRDDLLRIVLEYEILASRRTESLALSLNLTGAPA